MAGFIFPPGMPEEMKQQIEEMQERQEMANTSAKQQLSRFFQELTEDQVVALAEIFRICASVEQAIHYYEGFTRAVLATRFNKWPGWDDEPNVDTLVAVEMDSPSEVDVEAAMREYGLTRTEDGRLICDGCTREYISLEDRMLRAPGPDGCTGCVQKTKWG